MRMKVVIDTEKPRIEVLEATIPLPDDDVRDLIQELRIPGTSKVSFHVKEYEIGEEYVKIKAFFVNENKMYDQSSLKGGIPKDFLKSTFEQIRKVFRLSSELDLYPALKNASLVIAYGKGELHLKKEILTKIPTELITKNS